MPFHCVYLHTYISITNDTENLPAQAKKQRSDIQEKAWREEEIPNIEASGTQNTRITT